MKLPLVETSLLKSEIQHTFLTLIMHVYEMALKSVHQPQILISIPCAFNSKLETHENSPFGFSAVTFAQLRAKSASLNINIHNFIYERVE